jgi:hypothetical protein
MLDADEDENVVAPKLIHRPSIESHDADHAIAVVDRTTEVSRTLP